MTRMTESRARRRGMLFASLAILLGAATALASARSTQSPLHPKVGWRASRATARAQAPRGTIESQELEREHGKLIYSFDFRRPGMRGIQEVHVDALTGKVIAV